MNATKASVLPYLLTHIVLLIVAPRPAIAEDTQPTANLLPNPSFEDATDDGVRGWMSRAWQGEEHGRWSVASPGRSGERCLSIQSDVGTDAAWSTKSWVPSAKQYQGE